MSMPSTVKDWTLEELHRLPDDGNKYELVHGELFVTPAPNEEHETIAARLTRLLDPYVAEHGLGAVYRPRAVIRYRGSEVEPDLMVRAERIRRKDSWDDAPTPILVVEIISPTTRRRDRMQKRDLYREAGVAEYWVIDAESRSVLVVRLGEDDVTATDTLTWAPREATSPLSIQLDSLFVGVAGSGA